MSHLQTSEVQQLLHNKFVVVMGDSVQRTVYKDLVLLLQKDCLLSPSQLKAKGELSFEHDVLLEGGRRGRMHNGTRYREVRQFCSGHHLVRFYFLTRVYSQYVVEVLEELRQGEHEPDLVIMNSCLWELPRYGRNFRRGYCENLQNLFGLLDQVLSASCLLVWTTAMPVAEVVSSPFLPREHRRQYTHLREDVMEANFYSAVEASKHGFDVLDLHFYFRHAEQHRQPDGVHWDERAHRHISQLLLVHVAMAWGVDLPSCCPVGGRNRDDPADERREPARDRQPRDSRRGDRGEPSSRRSARSTGFRTHRRSSAPYSQARSQYQTHGQSRSRYQTYGQAQSRYQTYGQARSRYQTSQQSSQYRSFSSDPSPRRVGHTDEGRLRTGHDRHLGPSHRSSTQHQSRRYPPYRSWSPSESRRHRRRRTDRHTRERHGFHSQTYT